MARRLTIAHPCHEDWGKMTPNSEGRFCQVCEKTVVDLTQKTQEEMVALYEEKNGNMCGRMLLPVNRGARPAVRAERPVLKGRLRKFAIALLAALGFITFSADKVFAQDQPYDGMMVYMESAAVSAHVEAQGYPVEGAQIQIKSGRVIVAEYQTDANGIAAFSDIAPGDYEMVVRWKNEKMASRSLRLADGSDDRQDFVFEKENNRWKEVTIEEEPRFLYGDTIYFPDLDVPEKVEVIEIPTEYPVSAGVPVLIDDEVWTGTPAVDHIQDSEGQSAENNVLEGNISSGLEVTVFPNPMEGIFFAQINHTQKGAAVSLMVFDAKGQVLRQETHDGGEDLYLQVDLSDQAAGIYFVKIIHGPLMIEKRVVKL